MKRISIVLLLSIFIVGCEYLLRAERSVPDSDVLKIYQQNELILRAKIKELENIIKRQNPTVADINNWESKKEDIQRQVTQLNAEVTNLNAKKNKILAEIGAAEKMNNNHCVPSSNTKGSQNLKVKLNEENEKRIRGIDEFCKKNPPTIEGIEKICMKKPSTPDDPEGSSHVPVPLPLKQITIDCGRHKLRFVKIEPTSSKIDISLSEKKAKYFYEQAQLQTASPLFPFILKSVPEGGNGPIFKSINTFWIQTNLLENPLYKEIISDGSAKAVSHDDAQKVISTLNKRCQGYQFDLPSEEQFVYLARTIYDPAHKNENIKACSKLAPLQTAEGVKQLIGNQWQLTKTRCEQWNTNDPNLQCNPQSYIAKGGATNAKDATECLPEYRGESAPDIRGSNTSLRLILVNPP